jgi:short-subunit dehydrogenase
LKAKSLTVVITGATSGIGRELAVRYSKIADTLYLIARRKEMLLEMAFELQKNGALIKIYQADVTDFENLRAICRTICEESEKIDIVIANAGVSSEHKNELYDFWEFKKIIDTNLLGIAAIFDIFAHKMINQRGGKLVAISSLASFVAFPTTAAYSASKRAVNSFMDSMRLLLEPKNIKVINIQPGFIRTPLTDKNSFKMPFLMELDEASDKIYKAIEKNKKEYAFPFLFSQAAKNISRLPTFIRDAVVKKAISYEKQSRKRS